MKIVWKPIMAAEFASSREQRTMRFLKLGMELWL
jgi:hypothetical protein